VSATSSSRGPTVDAGSQGRRRTRPRRFGWRGVALALIVATSSLAAIALAQGEGVHPVGLTAFSGGSPAIQVMPTSGIAGNTLELTGSGFPANTNASLTVVDPKAPAFNLDGKPAPMNTPTSVHANGAGDIVGYVEIPYINNGVYRIIVTDGSAHAKATYHVTFGGTTFKLSSSDVAPGTAIKLKGKDFGSGDVEHFYIAPWSNAAGYKVLRSFNANAMGGFDHTWTVPTTFPAGTYVLIVIGSTLGTGAATLTIS
jgi:hypothetical protein